MCRDAKPRVSTRNLQKSPYPGSITGILGQQFIFIQFGLRNRPYQPVFCQIVAKRGTVGSNRIVDYLTCPAGTFKIEPAMAFKSKFQPAFLLYGKAHLSLG